MCQQSLGQWPSIAACRLSNQSYWLHAGIYKIYTACKTQRVSPSNSSVRALHKLRESPAAGLCVHCMNSCYPQQQACACTHTHQHRHIKRGLVVCRVCVQAAGADSSNAGLHSRGGGVSSDCHSPDLAHLQLLPGACDARLVVLAHCRDTGRDRAQAPLSASDGCIEKKLLHTPSAYGMFH